MPRGLQMRHAGRFFAGSAMTWTDRKGPARKKRVEKAFDGFVARDARFRSYNTYH